jgi:hypothetical protein
MAIEYGVHGADGRQHDLGIPTLDLVADLHRTPAGVLLLELNNQRLDLKGQAVSLPIGVPAYLRWCRPLPG